MSLSLPISLPISLPGELEAVAKLEKTGLDKLFGVFKR